MARVGTPPLRDAILDSENKLSPVWAKWISQIPTQTTDKVSVVASANASDLATAITLVNELKTVVNTLISAMRTSGLSKE